MVFDRDKAARRIIDELTEIFGSQGEIATISGVTRQTVATWRHRGCLVPSYAIWCLIMAAKEMDIDLDLEFFFPFPGSDHPAAREQAMAI